MEGGQIIPLTNGTGSSDSAFKLFHAAMSNSTTFSSIAGLSEFESEMELRTVFVGHEKFKWNQTPIRSNHLGLDLDGILLIKWHALDPAKGLDPGPLYIIRDDRFALNGESR